MFTVLPPDTTQTVGADVLTAVVDMLTPHTEYTVFVVGVTEEGGKGQSSNIVPVTTFEDGKCIYMRACYSIASNFFITFIASV